MNPRPWMILPLLALASASWARKPKPTGDSTTAEPLEQLSTSDIAPVMSRNRPGLQRCVRAQQEKEPDSEGKLEMSWAIRTDGTTHQVKCLSPELCDSYLAQCLTEEIQTWAFPRHKQEGEPTVFPFTF